MMARVSSVPSELRRELNACQMTTEREREGRLHSVPDSTSAAHFNNIDQYMEDLGGHLQGMEPLQLLLWSGKVTTMSVANGMTDLYSWEGALGGSRNCLHLADHT